jgi:hypothetical protein
MLKTIIITVAALSATGVSAAPQDALEQFRADQAAAAARIASPNPVDPADWECARPIIQRNHMQRVEARQLALRIADECTRPYRPRQLRTDADRVFESQESLTYTYSAQTFVYEIEAAIQQARRADAIKLN